MSPFSRRTVEEKEARALEKEQQRQNKQVEADRQEFLASPAGRARAAFERGDRVFQYAFDVMTQRGSVCMPSACQPPAHQ